MLDSLRDDIYSDLSGWKPARRSFDSEYKPTLGSYSWGVEEVTYHCFYVFLNISGEYAGREGTRENYIPAEVQREKQAWIAL